VLARIRKQVLDWQKLSSKYPELRAGVEVA
jgi:hypothetical protein